VRREEEEVEIDSYSDLCRVLAFPYHSSSSSSSSSGSTTPLISPPPPSSRVKIEARDVVLSKKITLSIVLVPTLWITYAVLLLSFSHLEPATVAVLFFCCPLFSYIGVMATEAGMVDLKVRRARRRRGREEDEEGGEGGGGVITTSPPPPPPLLLFSPWSSWPFSGKTPPPNQFDSN